MLLGWFWGEGEYVFLFLRGFFKVNIGVVVLGWLFFGYKELV